MNSPAVYGYNLFAYCGNDPVNNVDPRGYFPVFATPWIAEALITAFTAVGCLISIAIIDEASSDVMIGTIDPITSLFEKYFAKDSVKEKEAEKDITFDDPYNDGALYYEAYVDNDTKELIIITSRPMTFDEAKLWAPATANAGFYRKRKDAWGLYTLKGDDAYDMAYALGGPGAFYDTANKGEYPHCHTARHNYMGYKYFHVWYGSEIE